MTVRLAELTTLGVGGPVGEFVECYSEADIVDAVREADESETPLLVLGGGSNLVIADEGFAGRVVKDSRSGVVVADASACAGVSVKVDAGTPWDAVAERAVGEGWVGLEALAGIPGSTGATPVQNVGAYGAEVGDAIALVRTWDRAANRVRTFARAECEFGYRDSVFKRSMRVLEEDRMWHPSPRYVVLSVEFQLPSGSLSATIAYAQLADKLGVALGERAPLAETRAAILELRRSKGMVIDAGDPDTRSAGSFFTNPILDDEGARNLPDDAPRYPADGGTKTSAAWLIEQAGFGKGFALGASARATLSTKHTLALTNRGGATASEIVALARRVQQGVADRFGVNLEPEPVFVGVEL